MNLNMIGTGYVGLVTGACFAKNEDNKVICADVDAKKIEMLKKGQIPIYEDGLEQLVKEGLERGNLIFTTDIDYAVKNSLVNFICVGTPSKEDGSADLKYVEAVARSIGQSINEYKIIVDKSTVPLGTSKRVSEWIHQEILAKPAFFEYDIVSCPEFLKQGTAVDDFSKPDRVVIGVNSEKAKKIIIDLFAPFVLNGKPIITMLPQEAELVKYLANSFLASKVSFVNEAARIADKYTELTGEKIDVTKVLEGVCSDSRIGSVFMTPGPGYGGSCFPKDTREAAELATRLDLDLPVICSINKSNEIHKEYLLEKVIKSYDMLDTKTIAVWGLSFKAETDDIRESASITLINGLLEKGAKIQCNDPEAMDIAKKIFGDKVSYFANKYDAAKDADGLIVATEWSQFRTPDLEQLNSIMREKKIFDFRNLYGSKKGQSYEPLENRIKLMGFKYYGVGR